MDAPTLTLRTWGNMLMARAAGADARSHLEGMLKHNEVVTVDLAEVDTMTQLFADEFLGHLVASMGMETFKKCIRLRNATPPVQAVVRAAIGNRLETPPSE